MKKILVVEDDGSSLEYVRSVLERHGYQVLGTASGKDAIVLAERENPDLAIIDINLPDVSGTRVAEILSANPKTKGIPHFFLTGLLSSDDEVKLKNTLGGNFFMAKPCNTAKLLEEVAKRAR